MVPMLQLFQLKRDCSKASRFALYAVCHFKKVMHRAWDYFKARLAFTMAAFNLFVQWDGLKPDEQGRIHLSIAPFSL